MIIMVIVMCGIFGWKSDVSYKEKLIDENRKGVVSVLVVLLGVEIISCI
jgi:hypothetical protein